MSNPSASARVTSPKREWKIGNVIRILAVFGIVCALGAVWAVRDRHQKESAGKQALNVGVATRTQIYALGRLEPAGTVLKLSPGSGNEGVIVERLLVEEGDDVDAGETLAIFDNYTRRQAALAEANAHLAAAEAKLMQVRAGAKRGDIEAQEAAILLAESQAEVAANDLARALELRKKQAISSELIDQRQWEVRRLELEERRARGVLDGLREVRAVDIAVAEAEVTAAKASVVRAEAELSVSVLKSPLPSRVLKIHTRSGEKIGDRGVMEVGDVRRMQAVAEVFEADVAMIEPGMRAEIEIDSSGTILNGRVTEIGNLVSRKVVLTNDPVSDTDARVVEVRIDLASEHLEKVARLANARIEVTVFLESALKQTHSPSGTSVQTVSERVVQ